MRFLTLSGALLLLGLVSAEEPSLECAMYAEACESLCILNEGGELAASTCVKESTSCLCDGADMSEFVNQNAVGYINNLSENDLDQFIDSSYERYEAMLKESTQNNGAAASVVNDIAKLEQDGLKLDGMMNAQGAFDASTKNLKFNLVLEEQDDEEGDEDEGDEEEGDEDEGDEDEGDEDEGDEEEGDEDEGDEEAGKDDSNKNDKKEDKADADKDDDKKDAKGKGGADDKSKDTEKKPAEKALERAQDPFCQTFLSRCNDDCSASQAEATCALEDSNAGYLLACACNGVDISASVYAQVKAENQMVNI